MIKYLHLRFYIGLIIVILSLSSCSVLSGRKCNCPQWSMETKKQPLEILLSDAAEI